MKTSGAKTAAAQDFEDYLLAWNAVQGLTTPAHHGRIARWLDGMRRAERRRLVLMAFRGAGKSTVLGLFCAWLLSVCPAARILTLSADEALARRMLRSARKAIERHPASQRVRPARPEQWSALRFSVAGSPHGRDPSMLAAGLEGNITGTRADLVICDDVEVPKTCATPALRARLRARLAELDFVLTPRGTQLFAGTPHAWESIYGVGRAGGDGGDDLVPEDRSGFLDGFERLELPVMDAAGAPLWPERFDMPTVERLRRRSGPARFASQMMLQPADPAETRLDIGLIHPYDDALDMYTANGTPMLTLGGRRLRSAACWWDPAFGGTARRDASAIACVFIDTDGRYYIHDVRYLQPEPGETEADSQCRQVADFAARNLVGEVRIETNGIGRFLPGLLRKELAGSGIGVVEVATHDGKAARILKAFDVRLAAGVLHAHRDVLAGPLGDEMRAWRPVAGKVAGGSGGSGGSCRDDALDAVAGCLEAGAAPIRRTAPRRRPVPGWRPAGAVYMATMA